MRANKKKTKKVPKAQTGMVLGAVASAVPQGLAAWQGCGNNFLNNCMIYHNLMQSNHNTVSILNPSVSINVYTKRP